MQKKKLFLSLFALCSIVGMGITSCNNQGEQGPIGPEGPQGPEGPAGENGQDGQDGSLILTGEGKPEDSLGKDTDFYIDSKTGDLYQKENGTWSLVMNIKGEDGEDGSSGSSGSNGQTAWSNTILPTVGGYVRTSKGSALVGEEITFTIYEEESYDLNYLLLNDTKLEVSSLTKIDENNYSYTTTMVEGGFVVYASFSYVEQIEGGDEQNPSGNLNTTEEQDGITVDFSGVFKQSSVNFASNDSTINLKGVTLNSDASENNEIIVSGSNNIINVDEDSLINGFKLNVAGSDNVININGDITLNGLTISGENVVVNGSKVTRSSINKEDYSLKVEGKVELLGSFELHNLYLNVTSTGSYFINLKTSTKDCLIDGCYLTSNTILKVYGVKVFNLTNSYLYHDTTSNLLRINYAISPNSTISNNIFENGENAKGKIINFDKLFTKGTYDLSNNTFLNHDLNKQTLFGFTSSSGTNLEDQQIIVDLSNTKLVNVTLNEVEKQNNALINFNSAKGNTNNYLFIVDNLVINDEIVDLSTLTSEVFRPNEEETSLTKSYGLIGSVVSLKLATSSNAETGFLYPFLKQNDKVYNFNEESYTYAKKVLVDGYFYIEAVYDKNGNLVEDLSTKIDYHFEGNENNDGSITNPLEVNSIADFKTILSNEKLARANFYYKLNVDITLNDSDVSEIAGKGFNGYIDGNNHTLKVDKTNYESGLSLFGNSTFFGLENTNLELNNISLVSNFGLLAGFGGKDSSLTIKNNMIKGSIKASDQTPLTNVGLLTANGGGNYLEISGNNLSLDLDFTSSIGAYNGALVGGYFINDKNSEIIIKNNTLDKSSSIVGERVGFLFGNSAQMSYIEGTFDISNNINKGKIEGLVNADPYFAIGSVDGLNQGVSNEGTISIKDQTLEVSCIKDSSSNSYNLSYGDFDTSNLEVEAYYKVYSKTSNGTLLVASDKQVLDDVTKLEVKPLGYKENPSEDIVKVEVPESYYLVNSSDNREEVSLTKGYTISLRFIDKATNEIVNIIEISVN